MSRIQAIIYDRDFPQTWTPSKTQGPVSCFLKVLGAFSVYIHPQPIKP